MLLQAGEGIGFAQFGAAEGNAVEFVADASGFAGAGDFDLGVDALILQPLDQLGDGGLSCGGLVDGGLQGAAYAGVAGALEASTFTGGGGFAVFGLGGGRGGEVVLFF
jgi:hypothetical protein